MDWKCDNCGKKFELKKDAISHEKNCTKGKVSEFKRKCKECGKTWYSLESREKEIDKNVRSNNSQILFNCCNPSAQLQAKRNMESEKGALNNLKKCPNCHSSNYSEKKIYYDKK